MCDLHCCFRVRPVAVPARGDHAGSSLVAQSSLAYRDLEGLLAERGVDVDHVSIYRWVIRFTPLVIDAYRAVDQDGQVIDVSVSPRRDARAAKRASTRPSWRRAHSQPKW